MTDGSIAQSSRSGISPGTRLNGIYEIDHLIAAGGMGEVYKGHNIQTDDSVAIKVMLPELVENENGLALFRKEASALHHLHHEAIVRYYVFTIEPVLQRPYLAMEFVEGQSLLDLLRQGPLTLEAVRRLLRRVAAGLQAAHERGIIHRDVSPENIIISGGDVGRAKIIDFGIARSTDIGAGTVIGSGFAGKCNYVSPEQLGLFGGDVGPKSDIYSLGLVAVEALTGRPIDMGGSQVAIVDKRRKVPDLGAIDPRIRPLLQQMLQPDPAARPESMSEISARLGMSEFPSGRNAAGLGTRRERASASPSAADGGGRRKWLVAAGLAGLVFFGGIGAAVYVLRPSPPAKEAPPPSLQDTARLAPSQAPPASPPPTSPSAEPTPAAPPSAAPSPEPRPAGDASRAEQIARYLAQYDGGDCFFAAPATANANETRIEGFGASLAPFQVLDDAFKRANGFEADIGLRQVTQAQCPAVTFLSRLQRNTASAPRMTIGEANLRSGQAVTGTIDGYGDRNIELLLVSDEGTVHNTTVLLKPGTDGGKAFNMRMQRIGVPGAQPQLLIAIASTRPLEALKTREAMPAEQLFPAILAEAARTGQAVSATAKYFKLDR
jgi:serine/threonine protein kinase